MEYELAGKMIFIAVVFFYFGWLFRASRMEKQVIASNEATAQNMLDLQSEIYRELEFSKIDRDNVLQQQEEVLKILNAYDKQYMELNKLYKTENRGPTDAKAKLTQLRKTNKGIKNE